jgi:hypothetical protein
MNKQIDFVEDDSDPVSNNEFSIDDLPAADSQSGSVSAASVARRKRRRPNWRNVAFWIGTYVVVKLLEAM